MQRPEKYGTGPITPEELEDVFGFLSLHDEGILIDPVAPPDTTSGGIVVPGRVKTDRQTGSQAGHILYMPPPASDSLNEKAARFGKKVNIGDIVMFSAYAPLPAGFPDENGIPMLPGQSESPYACLSYVRASDVLGVIPKDKFNKRK